jgi:hypothetical protein
VTGTDIQTRVGPGSGDGTRTCIGSGLTSHSLTEGMVPEPGSYSPRSQGSHPSGSSGGGDIVAAEHPPAIPASSGQFHLSPSKNRGSGFRSASGPSEIGQWIWTDDLQAGQRRRKVKTAYEGIYLSILLIYPTRGRGWNSSYPSRPWRYGAPAQNRREIVYSTSPTRPPTMVPLMRTN